MIFALKFLKKLILMKRSTVEMTLDADIMRWEGIRLAASDWDIMATSHTTSCWCWSSCVHFETILASPVPGQEVCFSQLSLLVISYRIFSSKFQFQIIDKISELKKFKIEFSDFELALHFTLKVAEALLRVLKNNAFTSNGSDLLLRLSKIPLWNDWFSHGYQLVTRNVHQTSARQVMCFVLQILLSLMAMKMPFTPLILWGVW